MLSIDDGLKTIVQLCVSQSSGCAYCVDLHSTEALKAGVPRQKLECQPAAAEGGLYADKELMAFSWAECVRKISIDSDKDLLSLTNSSVRQRWWIQH